MTGTTAGRAETAPEPAGGGARGVVRSGGAHHDAPRRQPYYVIWAAPAESEDLLGVHHCSWNELVVRLGGTVIGSPFRDGKRFEAEEDAVAYFFARNSTANDCSVR